MLLEGLTKPGPGEGKIQVVLQDLLMPETMEVLKKQIEEGRPTGPRGQPARAAKARYGTT